jgi:hypothetical protein
MHESRYWTSLLQRTINNIRSNLRMCWCSDSSGRIQRRSFVQMSAKWSYKDIMDQNSLKWWLTIFVKFFADFRVSSVFSESVFNHRTFTAQQHWTGSTLSASWSLTFSRLTIYIYIYMSHRTANLQMLHNLRFFSSKCRLFHNTTLFGSCIIHILKTGCAKI